MEFPLLSIIVPVYNVRPYLEQCVRSLLAQTYPNLEIILVDDGSQDGSGVLCDQFASENSKICVLHQGNRGVSSARNAGLRAASGSFIGFVDADDWVEPDMYAHMIGLMEQEQTDAAFCGYCEDSQADGMSVSVEHTPAKTGMADRDEAIYQCLIGTDQGYYIVACNKCFRREILWPHGVLISFPENISLSEDEHWLSRVLQEVSHVSLTSQTFYHWRIRSDSASHELRCDASIRQVLQAQQEAAEQFAKSPKCASLAMGRVYDVMFRYVWVAYYTGDREAERYFRKQLKPYRKMFWKCSNFSILRKIKLLVVDWMCLLQFPPEWVSRVEQATS